MKRSMKDEIKESLRLRNELTEIGLPEPSSTPEDISTTGVRDLLYSLGFDSDGVYGDGNGLQVNLHHFQSPIGSWHRPPMVIDPPVAYILPVDYPEDYQEGTPFLMYKKQIPKVITYGVLRELMTNWGDWDWARGPLP